MAINQESSRIALLSTLAEVSIRLMFPLMSLAVVQQQNRLGRDLRDQHPRHFRIKPANAVGAYHKIRRVEDMPFDVIQHRAIDLRPLRLHQIEYDFDDPSPARGGA